jgi:hypothetical protein
MLLRKFHDIESKAFSKSINKNKPGISFSSAYSIISNKSQNWRPISLLNTLYKIGSGVIANRIKKVLPTLIDNDQTGFIAGRYIGENIRLLFDIMEYAEENDIPGLFLLIDFEKAFDSISWNFLSNILKFFNFGESIQKWVKTFYNNIKSAAECKTLIPFILGFSLIFIAIISAHSMDK